MKTYQFFLFIVQEFLSAYALSLKSSEDQTVFWGERLVKGPIIETGKWEDHNLPLYADRRFETIFQFYAGLTGLQDSSIQQLLFNTVDTNEGLVLSYDYPVTSERSVVVYESQNEKVAKQLFSPSNPSLTIRSFKQPQQWMWCLQCVSFSSLSIEGSVSFLQLYLIHLLNSIFDIVIQNLINKIIIIMANDVFVLSPSSSNHFHTVVENVSTIPWILCH